MSTNDLLALAGFVGVPQILGYLSSAPVSKNQDYYQSINKPFWAPPQFVYRPLLTLFYGLMGISSYLIYSTGEEEDIETSFSLTLYTAQLFLSIIWPTLFFKIKSRFLALLCLGGINLFLVATIVAFEQIDERAARLMIPYLVYALVVGYFNKVVWRRNSKSIIPFSSSFVESTEFCSSCGQKMKSS